MHPEHARKLVAAVAEGPALVLVAPQAQAAAPAKVAVGLRATCGLLRLRLFYTSTCRHCSPMGSQERDAAQTLGCACLTGDLARHIKRQGEEHRVVHSCKPAQLERRPLAHEALPYRNAAQVCNNKSQHSLQQATSCPALLDRAISREPLEASYLALLSSL